MIQPYQAVVLQNHVREARDADTRDEIMRANAWRQLIFLRRMKFSYPRLKLVVGSELSTHGLDAGRTTAVIAPLSLDLHEELFQLYTRAARELELYVSFSMQERDENFPGTFFHTGVLIDPAGKVIVRQFTLNAVLAHPGWSSVYTRYKELYGDESILQVVDTPLGRLGLVVGGDLHQPEVARMLALKGCEVLIHSIGSRETETAWMTQAFRQSTAYFNQAYLLCSNIGAYQHKAAGTPPPPTEDAFMDALKSTFAWGEFEFCGRSQVVDYNGRILAICNQAGEAATGAVIDIERLRYERQVRGRLKRLRGDVLQAEYGAFPGLPNDTSSMPDPGANRRERINQMQQSNVLQKSEAYQPR